MLLSSYVTNRKHKRYKKRQRQQQRIRLRTKETARRESVQKCFEPLEPRVLLSGLVWTSAPDLPDARTDAVAVLAPNDAIHLLGGSTTAPRAVPQYLGDAVDWTLAPDLDSAKPDGGAARVGSQVYFFGGADGTEGSDESAIYDYQFGDSQDIDAKMVSGRFDFGFGADSLGRVYAIGGIANSEDGGELLSEAERYEPDTEQWVSIAPLLQAIHGMSAIGDGNGHIFVFGGSTTLSNSGLQDTSYVYDIASNTWNDTIAPMPIGTRDSAVVIDDAGTIYVLGGYSANGAEDAVQVYDPIGDSWSMGTDLPEAVYSHAASFNSLGRIIVAGGIDATGIPTAAAYRTQRLDIPETVPVITTTADPDVTPGDPYTYDVNAIGNPDPAYSLVASPEGMTIDVTTGVIDWVPTVGQVGDHDVTVRASSQAGDADQTFTVSVIADSTPVITTAAVTTASHSQVYTYDVEATGSPAPTYSLVVAPDGMMINATTGVISWQPNVNQFGDFDVTVRASNRAGDVDQAFVITGLVDTIGPTSTTLLQIGTVTTISIDLSWPEATDNVGVDHYNVYRVTRTPPRRFRQRKTIYTLIQTDITATSTTISGLEPLSTNKYVVRAVDAEGNESANSNAVQTQTLSPPSLDFRSSQGTNVDPTGPAKHLIEFRLISSANPAPTFSLVTGPDTPNPITVDFVTGAVAWTPAVADVGINDVTFRATNTINGVEHSTDLTVPITVTSDVPVLFYRFGDTPYALAGTLFTVQISDRSNTPPDYSLLDAPAGMTIDVNTGLISWTPIPGDAGRQTVTVQAINDAGTDELTFGFETLFADSVSNIQITDLAQFNPTATWTAPIGEGSDRVAGYTVNAVYSFRFARIRRSHRVEYDVPNGQQTSLLLTGLRTVPYALTVTPYDAAGNKGLATTTVDKFVPRPALPVVKATVKGATVGPIVSGNVIAGQPMEIVLTDSNPNPSTIVLVDGPDGLAFDPTTNIAQWTPSAADITPGYSKTNVTFEATNSIGPVTVVVPLRVFFSGPILNASATRAFGSSSATVRWDAPTDNVSPIVGYRVTRHWTWSGRRRSTTFTVGPATSLNVGLFPRGAVSHKGVTITPLDADGNLGVPLGMIRFVTLFG